MNDEIKSKIAEGKANGIVDKVKIDVGLSHNAPISRKWLELHNDRLVIGIEPDPSNAANARRDLGDHDRFCLIEAACDLDNGEKVFYHLTNADTGCCSLNKPTTSEGWEYEEVTVKTINLADLLKYLLTEYHFIEQIKTDTQGHDEIVLGSVKEYLPFIAFYDFELTDETQYNLSYKPHTREYLINLMEEQDFVFLEESFGNLRFANKRFSQRSDITNECGLLS
jgi:FkbM family methyltransferase